MAEFTKSYKAKGVLSTVDMELTETVKEKKEEHIVIHDLEAALKFFEGDEIVITISKKEDVAPKEVEGEA